VAVHIPDGYLGPETLAAGWAACTPAWYWANKKAKQTLTEPKSVPMLAASAAFSFLIMMLNVPVFGGTTAHAVGAVLIAVIAGPEIAVLAVSAALVIQALLFADGGLLSLGINCFNMAVAMPLVGYGVYRLAAGDSTLRSARRLVAVGLAAYVGIIVAATLAGLELGLQPALHSVGGVAQYAPYGLKIALPAMLAGHLLVAGPVELAFSAGVFAFLARTSPELLKAGSQPRLKARWLWGVVVALLVAVPLGLISGGTAWGEWGSGELRRKLGYVPAGFARFGDLWSGVMPGYSWPGKAGGMWAVAIYLASGAIGVAALAGVAWLFVASSRRRGLRD
jgi:cobalt/nickel transport system permease protein